MSQRKGSKPVARHSLKTVPDEDTLCAIPRDHYDVGDWTISTDAACVWVTEQKPGEPPTQSIALPRSIFNRLLARYEQPQRMVRKVRR